MTDEDTTTGAEGTAEPRPMWLRAAGWAGAAVAIGLLLWAAVHVGIPPVHPERSAPPGHYTAACWTCHLVSDKAPLAEGE